MENLMNTILQEVQVKYKAKLERPWSKYPEYVTCKDEVVDKWFALFMIVSGDKLGLDPDTNYSIVNVKADEEMIGFVAGTRGILPAYHMNKRHWLTLLLDGSLEKDRIMSLIDDSYELVTNTPTKRIYEAVKNIPKGKVATYGQVATMAGNPKMSRAVGNALHKNPDGDEIPCYRVVNSKGELADQFVFGGVDVQKKRLEADGIEVINNTVDLGKYGMKG